MKKIAVVGTGYVGLVTGTCFAETGNQVICVDIDKQKVERMRSGEVGGHHLIGSYPREGGVPRLQGSVEPKKGAGHARGRRAAEPQHAKPPAARRRRDGNDGVVGPKHDRGKG